MDLGNRDNIDGPAQMRDEDEKKSNDRVEEKMVRMEQIRTCLDRLGVVQAVAGLGGRPKAVKQEERANGQK